MSARKPTHPGVVFKYDVLEALGITITQAAKMLNVTRKALSEVLNEKAGLSPEMAVKWGLATNTTPESWLNMQKKLDLWVAKQKDYDCIDIDKLREK